MSSLTDCVLITGGAGFLGRRLAAALARDGSAVTLLDDLSSENSSFRWQELQSPRITHVLGSTCDRSLVTELVHGHRCVVHFASVVGVEHTMVNRIPTMHNLAGTIALVEALTSEHIVLFGSSADVYGLHSHIYDRPMREDDLMVYEPPEIDRWIYAKVKALEENLIAHSRARAINVRIFNCYGPGMDRGAPKRLIPQFLDNLLAGRPLRINGDGQQRRAMCYYEDTVRGLLLAMRYASQQRAPFTTTFNIGSAETHSVFEIAQMLIEARPDLGLVDRVPEIQTQVEIYSHPFDDSWHRVPDLTRSRKILGYQPTIPFHEGIRRTLRQHHRRMAAPTQHD